MSAWKETVARSLRALHLDTIRNKILLLVAVAALVPALATSVASYRRGRRALDARVAQELRGAASEAARQTGMWLDVRLQDLRLRASSYVVAENLARIEERAERAQALTRLREFLNSVRERIPDHEALVLLDTRGRVVTTSAGRTGRVQLTLDELKGLRTGDAVVSDAYWDAGFGKAVVTLTLPIRHSEGRFLGAFVAKTSLTSLGGSLAPVAPDGGDAYLITDEGRLVLSSRLSSADLMRQRLPDTTTNALLSAEGAPASYRHAEGEDAIGVARRVPQLRWAAVAEIPRAGLSRPVAALRAATVGTLALLLAGVGLVAYGVTLVIARPIERLAAAAARATDGDLSVDVPVGGRGEVGALTRAVSHLVGRLREREGQGELERLSVTDALTGLYNRRHLVGTLANEVQRSRRLRRTFSVLMADVDHFKKYNDTHGHLAGDAALVKLAEILRQTTRGVDCVARYGGEEFLVLLLETTIATAVIVAERIRSRVATEAFDGGRITVSIGVAEYPPHGDTPEELIASADAAMYRAKGEGRDRVVAAGEQPKKARRRRAEA